MSTPDFNLLVTLDVLLAEGSVARAARRLRLSPSAMSRALARLRETTGDPLLVRAGRNLVPTPRALELRERVGAQAPGVRLRFVQKPDRESTFLRDGSVDLETGVIGQTTSPEVRVQALFRDRFIGVVRPGHPLCEGEITPARYAAGRHVGVSRRGFDKGPVDEALRPFGLERDLATVVGGFSTALALARDCDLIASVPERHTAGLRRGLHSFALPMAAPELTVSMMWHPRMDGDLAHRWLRARVREVCAAAPAIRHMDAPRSTA